MSGGRIGRQLQSALDLAQTSGASADLIKAITTARDMLTKKDEYTLETTSDHTETCRKVEDNTNTRDWKADYDQGRSQWHLRPMMATGRLEGQFLKSLVSMQKAKRILEVGMFTGYGSLSMAEALPADGEVVSLEICEMLKGLVEQWTETSPHAKKIKIRIGDATGAIEKMAQAGDKFDMIFLDGDKKDYVNIVKIVFDQNLLNPSGTVLVDNAYFIGSAYDPSADSSMAREMVDFLNGRPDLHRVMVPMNDGILMIRRLTDVEAKMA